jgi:hypothetical protein
MSWPDTGCAPPPQAPPPGSRRARFAGVTGILSLAGGIVAVSVGILSQQHAPQPAAAAAGMTGTARHGPSLGRSEPLSVTIPAINVHSKLLRLGLNRNGSIAVPPLPESAGLAAWYKYSVTPGQIGPAVIEGHVDSYAGPAVFFRLGALHPGNTVNVTLADGVTAIFRVTGVREYRKNDFPDKTVYGRTDYAALRLITCGGSFDHATRHYLSSTVVFASLVAYRSAAHPRSAT